MAYNVACVADFGANNSGLTIHGKLLDMTGVLVGSAVTSGIVESSEVDGTYLYTLSAPDGHSGAFVMYDASNAALRRVLIVAPRETENADTKTSTRGTSTLTAGDIDSSLAAYDAPTKSDIPGTAAIATAIYAVAVETGHDLTTVLRAIYAATRGRSVADNADDPTTVTYYAPDNSTARIVHTLTDTERTVA